MASLNKISSAVDILEHYQGSNPFINDIKRDVVVFHKIDRVTDFVIDYILRNKDFDPKPINKIIKIADWYGAKKKNDWNLEFIPEKLKIINLLGETNNYYHCYVRYRQSADPVNEFIPKNAVITNFLVEDYHSINVDFDRYDKLSMSRDPNRRLKEHQKEGVKFLLGRKKCVLADGQGMGKTTELSVAAVEGNFDAVVIICPSSMKTTWKDELMWYVPERDITIVGGLGEKSKGDLEKIVGYKEGKSGLSKTKLLAEVKETGTWVDNRYIIVNYDVLDTIYQIPQSRSAENIKKAEENSPLLRHLKNKKSLLIVDEAHKLSNTTSIRYKIIKDIIKRAEPHSIYLATGTPITNSPQSYFNIVSLLSDPLTSDWNFYMKRYCGAVEMVKDKKERDIWTKKFLAEHRKNTWFDLNDLEKEQLKDYIKVHCKMMLIPKEPTNIEELKERTAHIYLRRVKEDLTDMPPKHIHELFYDLNMSQIMTYNSLWDEYQAEQLTEDPTKELNKSLLEGAIYRRYLSKEMIPNTIKLADEKIAKGEKVVIICCFDEELYTLRDYYKDKCVIYNGKMNLTAKDAAKEKFMKDENTKVFIGNLIACGVGLTLTASHTLIFNDFDYIYANNSQCEDRVHRIGQTHEVDIYYQIFKSTQYERMWNTQLRRQTLSETVIKKEDEK